ncbi:glycosyl hydrolase family 18 protein [Fusibacter sp. 3D3]|uniref:glycosyl hydrolase family 18 protein n=1 Tax=Fusibacter sp. 3D3 TaxID=1048380 RepID=UPI000852FFF4|nr:glycosyl hydrolase family 18 protein [Fusibacter sp. 3D3]GAU77444.1 possible surface protein with ChW-repeats [Fusibacter sp. 3D3]
MMKKVLIITLILMMLISQLSLADNSDIPKNHWVNNLIDTLKDDDIMISNETIVLGGKIKYKAFIAWISRIEENAKIKTQSKIEFTKSETEALTRIEAVKISIQYLGFDWLAQQLKTSNLVFTDVSSDKGYVQLAFDFGLVSSGKVFRPDDPLTSEEAIAFIYHLNRLKKTKIDRLHSYYAINSYSQLDKVAALDALSYGWSRLEISKVNGDVILNSSSQNDNEYRVPSGYTEAVKAADNNDVAKYLMVAVKDELVYDETLKKELPLTEYILNNSDSSSKAISLIATMLVKNSQRINYQGVLIDFESLKGQETGIKFNLFLSNLKVALEEIDKSLIVAVHPVRKAGIAYYDGYDYKSIGRLADYVILMAHDFYPKKLTKAEMKSGYTITPLVAINDLYYALKGITHSETGVIDKNKIILQFSMDSVQWKLKEGSIINEMPYHPTYSAISSRISSGVAITYSDGMKSPYIIFEDNEDKTRNIVWYEDQRSLQAKIDLMKYFGITNTSIWRLGSIADVYDRPNETRQYLNLWDQFLQNE